MGNAVFLSASWKREFNSQIGEIHCCQLRSPFTAYRPPQESRWCHYAALTTYGSAEVTGALQVNTYSGRGLCKVTSCMPAASSFLRQGAQCQDRDVQWETMDGKFLRNSHFPGNGREKFEPREYLSYEDFLRLRRFPVPQEVPIFSRPELFRVMSK